MKRILAFLLSLCLLFLFGCQGQDSEVSLRLNTYELGSVAKLSENDVELLRVDGGKIYINELDTFTNPFLFTTKALLVLNPDGSLDRRIKPETDKRIVDLVEFDGALHYFNLIARNDEYYIELCTFDSSFKEQKVTEYKLDDPYAYPRFVKFGNEYFYKVNETVYKLSDKNVLLKSEESIFLSKPAPEEGLAAYKTSTDDGYSFSAFDKDKETELDGNYGSFALTEKGVVYLDAEDKALYLKDDKTKKAIYSDDEVYDFAIFDENRIIIATFDKVLLYDLSAEKTVAQTDKPKSSIRWIFSDMDGTACLYSGDSIHRFTVQEK